MSPPTRHALISLSDLLGVDNHLDLPNFYYQAYLHMVQEDVKSKSIDPAVETQQLASLFKGQTGEYMLDHQNVRLNTDLLRLICLAQDRVTVSYYPSGPKHADTFVVIPADLARYLSLGPSGRGWDPSDYCD